MRGQRQFALENFEIFVQELQGVFLFGFNPCLHGFNNLIILRSSKKFTRVIVYAVYHSLGSSHLRRPAPVGCFLVRYVLLVLAIFVCFRGDAINFQPFSIFPAFPLRALFSVVQRKTVLLL